MISRLFLGFVLAFSALLAADANVTGSVTYRARIALAPDAEIEVQLADVSRADAKATVLALKRIKPSGQVPIPFNLIYDDALIQPNHDYAVSARIYSRDKLQWITDQRYSVITRGHPSTVELLLQPVPAIPAAK